MNIRSLPSLGLALCLSTCSEGGADLAVDLPQGWQGSVRVSSFQQSACNGSPSGGPSETLELATTAGAVHATYHHAHFRCSQTVEGFARFGMGTIALLVQPADMNPSQVVRCDCLYDITMSMPAPPGAYELTLYRRWDHKSGADDPVQVASQPVTVP